MRERFHVLVIDTHTGAALTGSQGRHWLLPIFHADEHTRAASLIEDGLRRTGMSGHLASIPCGRMSAKLDEIDRLAVWATAGTRAWRTPSGATWQPLDRLNAESAFLPVQFQLYTQWWTRRRNQPHTSPYDSLDWLPNILAWADASIRHQLPQPTAIEHVRHHRASPGRVVLELVTKTGSRVYFKGASEFPFIEGRLTTWLAQQARPTCPPVLAFDDARGWLLSTSAAGRPLTRDVTFRDCAHVVVALARIQKVLADRSATLRQLGVPALSWPAVVMQVEQMWLALVEQRALTPGSDYQHVDGFMIEEGMQTVRRLVEAIERLMLPPTWTDTDLAPGNIFLTTHLQLVDLEKSIIAFPHLAIETFLANMARVAPATIAWQDGLRRLYARGWGRRPVDEKELQVTSAVVRLASRIIRIAQRAQHTDRSIDSGELDAPIGALKARAGWAVLRLLNEWRRESFAR